MRRRYGGFGLLGGYGLRPERGGCGLHSLRGVVLVGRVRRSGLTIGRPAYPFAW
jgi:hypothetical protein